ncbi:MAG: YbaB/EbfC family nucleoid-associated protein [Patescibacteria group bacterium]
MLDKLKDLNNLRKIQSEMKKQLEEIFVSGEKGDYSVVIRGDKRIERIEVDGEEDKELKDLLNKTMKDVDKKVQKKLKGQLGDLGLPGF